ncbi:U4/U6 small nuclear ribonucleoprotein Prp4, putative [Entamoeba invadens IP1]|uniref:U4/U6 small nuclear ribonucleoprotein Prp4, putative n=1 Tax=Entamoeba invadens IP1 TaxID=370355 RepID=A0A0A1U495_ENTIV|nr:U4/U6 small nuclear ribonucleoprotein Prp4, putative [Entamoeba invadens IP1]ELP87538.1 U4/U6 small nuclear ribonucleoprotein Prp4, putative [Entamoeba invadens IP1]|eukprot:XP_004254309.1 U4/U6 small nuclear ribonucleoprotein Prp4, putative [Entamoeba invadens IP1]
MEDIAKSDEYAEKIRKLEEKWKFRKIPLPTDDRLIMLRLREIGEPIKLFSESFEDRRERLRNSLTKVGSDQGFPQCAFQVKKDEERKTELHYTEGCEELLEVRRWILVDSILRASNRHTELKQKYCLDNPKEQLGVDFGHVNNKYKEKYRVVSSFVADDLRVLKCDARGSDVITGGGDGHVRLFDVENGQLKKDFATPSQIYSLQYSPDIESPIEVVSGGQDGCIRIFMKNTGEPLILKAHEDRVNSLNFHPSGRFLLSASHDSLIKMWDLEIGACVLTQTGHVKPVRSVVWQQDGGVCVSGGDDKYISMWDIRSGKRVLKFEGHSGSVTSLDWHCDGMVLASSSEDNTVKLWDVRMKKCGFTIPAHNNIVMATKFKSDGNYLLTSCFDHSVKLFDVRNWEWKEVERFEAHSKAVTDIAWINNGFVSCGLDKTLKVYLNTD